MKNRDLIAARLLLLVRENPGIHGWGIRNRLVELDLLQSLSDAGQMYRALRGMEAKRSAHQPAREVARGPDRRVYVVTPAGEAALRDTAALLERRADAFGQFLPEYQRSALPTVAGQGGGAPLRLRADARTARALGPTRNGLPSRCR